MVMPIARDPGHVVDYRDALADDTVKQTRLAHIGPADDRNGKHALHIFPLMDNSARASWRATAKITC